jgi:tetratricopeptide (TPR) repeat protein
VKLEAASRASFDGLSGLNYELMRARIGLTALLLAGAFLFGCGKRDKHISELQEAEYLEQEGHLEEAVKACTRALEQERNTYLRVKALNKRAYLRAQLKQYKEALADADEALTVDPRSYMSHACRGIALDGLERYHDAVVAYTRAIELEPRDSRVFFNRGQTHTRFGYTDLALKDFSAAIESNPRQSAYYYYRGCVHYERGEYQETVSDMEQYMRMIQAALVEEGVYATYGAAQYFLGNYKQADENFKAAAILYGKTQPQQSEVMGGFYLQVWDSGRALKYYDEAIALDSTNAVFYFERGQVKYASGDTDSAFQDISRAIDLGHHEASAYGWHGWLLAQKGSYDLAVSNFEHSITSDLQRADAYLDLGDVAMLRGDKVAALEAYRRGLEHSRERAQLSLRYMMLDGVLSDELRDYLSQFSGKSWPYALIRYYQNRATEEEVLVLAAHPNQNLARARLSEAYFYIGARHLAKGETESARSYFRKAAECRHCFAPSEWFLAQKELETGFLDSLLQTNAASARP